MIDFPSNPTVGQNFTAAGVTWTWDGAKWTATGLAGGPFLPLVGGTMTGELVLHADPVNPLDAATKEYVDTAVTAGGPFLPLTGGTITGNLNLASSNPVINFNKPSGSGGTLAYLAGETNGVTRWVIEPNNPDAETGNNAGANFAILNFSDSGVQLGTPLFINRATGQVTVPSLAAPQAIGDNRIINGDMRIDQRHNGASGSAVNAYTVDRWIYYASQAGKAQLQRQPSGTFAFPYNLNVVGISAYTPLATDFFMISQPIEADMISDFLWGSASAQPVTLSFWVYAGATGTYSGSIQNYASTRSYPFTFTVPAVSTWTQFVIHIPGDTAGTWVMQGNAGSLLVNFDLGSGANFRGPANAWAAANYAGVPGTANIIAVPTSLYLTGVKLEIGNVATPFNRQSLAKSLADCQRYYQAANTFVGGYNTASGPLWVSYYFPVVMRVVPTVAFLSSSTSNMGAISLNAAQTYGCTVQATMTAAGGGWSSSSTTFAAEL